MDDPLTVALSDASYNGAPVVAGIGTKSANVNAASRSGGVLTFGFTGGTHPFLVGDPVVMTNLGPATFNGSFIAASVAAGSITCLQSGLDETATDQSGNANSYFLTFANSGADSAEATVTGTANCYAISYDCGVSGAITDQVATVVSYFLRSSALVSQNGVQALANSAPNFNTTAVALIKATGSATANNDIVQDGLVVELVRP